MTIIKKHPFIVWGAGITLLFLIFFSTGIKFLDSLEFKLYDVMMRMRAEPEASSDIVMVEIDDDSIDKLGRWPWPRSLLANAIKKISEGNPKVIGLNLLLSEPEESSGLKELKQLKSIFVESGLNQLSGKGGDFLNKLNDAETRLDNDKKLSDAVKESGKVILPTFFKEGQTTSEDAIENNKSIINQSLPVVKAAPGSSCPKANEIVLPIPGLFNVAKGIGHINLGYDPDGTVRRERVLYDYRGLFIPSYTLRIAASYLNISFDNIKAEVGTYISLGSLELPLTTNTELLINFKGARGSFKSYSFFDVINDKIKSELFKNKIVLIAPSAAGIFNPLSTPTDSTMPVGEFSAHTIWSILNNKNIKEPDWSGTFGFLMILAIGAIITFIFPRFKARLAGMSFIGLFIVLFGGSMYLFVSKGLWVGSTYLYIHLIFGYIGVLSIKYFITEVKKEKVEGESAETNRMLGIQFQAQGMLDMAFDKFRSVPVDAKMKDLLYNLALDFERKRQFNKAASVFEHIESYDPKFKDVSDRKKKLMQASDTMVFGEGFLGGTSSGADPLLATGTGTKPTLGRYEIVKQLGKGAMGIVYLGQDPRINRTTAIKTFRFTQDLTPEEAEQTKIKFFREAESAGTLSHPHIVTIYDAGEEQELAYIAMEFLEGEDLQKYTKPETLLPLRKVIGYVADVADALDYAHQKGIVHRDIKPANIMLLKSGIVKITDFGIARITASSQTQTGVVKGTPYYMSPEQISGQKVDGRSDIFSVGVMLYQMVTGKVPFFGEGIPQLMHQIMHVAPPDPKQFNPKIPNAVVTIINKSLEKDREKRYQKASMMAAHLREVGQKMDLAAAAKTKQ
ncbi:MAG: CHASE2 domain-containing protein [Desulfobacterales bacterium]|nr:CHASE2 domain-containing protein [Desulfobacterales bacterium]MBF0395694.1 CHASE2 domain-containing protein [Desulfobacterales bacterium]